MVILPPPPVQENEFSSNWRTWLLKVKEQLSNLSTIAWSSLSFTGSNITDIVTRNHNDTSSKQGGTTNEYYHLTSAHHTSLTTNVDSTIHYHSSDRDRANHTGTQLLATISDAGTAAARSGLSVTITTAKLTSGGANGSMTFTNGVLTSQTAAT